MIKENLMKLLMTIEHMRLLNMGFSECADHMISCGVTIPVRCKDCLYCQQDSHGLWCFNDYEHNLQPNGYCSYGEKKDGDGDA